MLLHLSLNIQPTGLEIPQELGDMANPEGFLHVYSPTPTPCESTLLLSHTRGLAETECRIEEGAMDWESREEFLEPAPTDLPSL